LIDSQSTQSFCSLNPETRRLDDPFHNDAYMVGVQQKWLRIHHHKTGAFVNEAIAVGTLMIVWDALNRLDIVLDNLAEEAYVQYSLNEYM